MIGHQSIVLLTLILGVVSATDVKKCSDNKPFPLDVRVYGCETMPCNVIKGRNIELDIDFVVYNHVSEMKTQVIAKALGLNVPYELPEETSNVCRNLMYGAYCPLYPEEDVTYKFLFPVSSIYPEISVRIEVTIVDQDKDILTCFACDIKVRKGESKIEKNLQSNEAFGLIK